MNTNRRAFLKNSGAIAFGSLVFANRAAGFAPGSALASRPVGLQLYTVMSKIDADLDGTLKRIAEIGYTEIESAFSLKGGYYGLKPKEFAAKLKGYGLTWKAHHTGGAPFKRPAGWQPPLGSDGKPFVIPPMKNLRDNYQEVVNDVAEGGVSYLVCSSTPIDSLDDIKQSIDTLSKSGEACKKAGIGFAFHNHTKEFDRIEGQIPYEMFLSQISPDIMKMELDLGWATKAGADPVELFKKHPGRFPLWHVKDLDRVTQKPVEVGLGYADLKRVFDAADTAGLQHFFVEQDAAPQPLDNIATSFANIRKMIG